MLALMLALEPWKKKKLGSPFYKKMDG